MATGKELLDFIKNLDNRTPLRLKEQASIDIQDFMNKLETIAEVAIKAEVSVQLDAHSVMFLCVFVERLIRDVNEANDVLRRAINFNN